MENNSLRRDCIGLSGSSVLQWRHKSNREHNRQGMTLFEVSLSLVIVAFGVISVLMILPAGIKAQEMARFQIYVSAKAEEMIEQFSATPHSNPNADSEGLAMWDLPVAHKAQSWDFESRLSASRFGNMPLPMDIARRLDSPNDEIREILDNGGYIYYSQPRATSGIEDAMPSGRAPNESQRVIIGIKGYAQQNWMSSFPLKKLSLFCAMAFTANAFHEKKRGRKVFAGTQQHCGSQQVLECLRLAY